jgi:hypothetical protein
MKADNLTRAQYRALKNKIEPMVGYLHRLRVRMQKRGFPPEDPLMELVMKATDAVNLLHADVHCRSIDGQGFNPRRS